MNNEAQIIIVLSLMCLSFGMGVKTGMDNESSYTPAGAFFAAAFTLTFIADIIMVIKLVIANL